MSHALTPTNQYVLPVVPDDGDNRSAGSVLSAFQPLCDSVEFVKERVPGAADSYELNVPMPMLISATNWSFTAIGGPGGNAWGIAQITSGASLVIPISMPVGDGAMLLDYLTVEMHPANAHGGTTIVEPVLSLYKQAVAGTAAPTLVATTTFPDVTSLPAYEAPQTFTLPLNEIVTNGHQYWIFFGGEAGADFAAGLLITKIKMAINRL